MKHPTLTVINKYKEFISFPAEKEEEAHTCGEMSSDFRLMSSGFKSMLCYLQDK